MDSLAIVQSIAASPRPTEEMGKCWARSARQDRGASIGGKGRDLRDETCVGNRLDCRRISRALGPIMG
jgi:hypothetical protein